MNPELTAGLMRRRAPYNSPDPLSPSKMHEHVTGVVLSESEHESDTDEEDPGFYDLSSGPTLDTVGSSISVEEGDTCGYGDGRASPPPRAGSHNRAHSPARGGGRSSGPPGAPVARVGPVRRMWYAARRTRQYTVDFVEQALFGGVGRGYFDSRSAFARWVKWRCIPLVVFLLLTSMAAYGTVKSMPKPVPDWTACDNTSFVSPLQHAALQRRVLRHRRLACTTQYTDEPQPCGCCIGAQGKDHDCFKDVRVIWNSTTMGEFEDDIDVSEILPTGFPMYSIESRSRVLPVSIVACFTSYWETDNNTETCATVRGPRVSNVFRAIELLRGWTPAGDKPEVEVREERDSGDEILDVVAL